MFSVSGVTERESGDRETSNDSGDRETSNDDNGQSSMGGDMETFNDDNGNGDREISNDDNGQSSMETFNDDNGQSSWDDELYQQFVAGLRKGIRYSLHHTFACPFSYCLYNNHNSLLSLW